MVLPNPPQVAPKWNHTLEEILELTKKAIEERRAVLDSVAALEWKDCTFENVFAALDFGEAKFKSVVTPTGFYQHVSPSKDVRDASTEAQTLVRDFEVEASMRLDVFQAKQAAQKNIQESGRRLLPEERRLLDRMTLDGQRNGLGLPKAEREKLTVLQKQLSQTCLEFRKNSNEENGFVSFTLAELKGVPDDVVSGCTKRTEGDMEVYDIRFKGPDIHAIFRYAELPETRYSAHKAYENRLPANEPLMTKMVNLRRQIAKLLGYASWADYITEVKMVKTAQGVKDFLEDLAQRLRPIGLRNRETQLALKKEEYEEKGWPFDGEFYVWDASYYNGKNIERTLQLDAKLVKQHFPVSRIVSATLDIYRKLFSIQIIEVDGEVWHPDVKMYAVWEKDAKTEADFIGYFYMDLYAREGKFPSVSCWTLLRGYDKTDGSRAYPVDSIVASLAKPNPITPALMGHFDVVLFFHEMGHVFHDLLSKTKFHRFHGVEVSGDFEEAPSQMLEHWCYNPKVLGLMSSHYETQEPLSADLIEALIKSRHANVGLFNLRQVSLGMFDLKLHMDEEPGDPTELWTELRESIALLKGKLGPGQAGFGHLAGGYSAGYYGYLWSQVFAADMYDTVFKTDPLDPECGKRYREAILLPGGSKDDLEMLEAFLGRAPNSEAFTKLLFGNQEQ